MRYERNASLLVDAIEWTGENLREVQAFLFPKSPLDHDNGKQLGLNVFDPSKQYGQTTKLQFITAGTFIIKEDDRIYVATREEFEKQFRPVTPMETAEPEGLITHVEPGL